MTTFHIITLFPESLESYLGASIIKRAIEDKKIFVKYYNPRDFVENKWQRVDQRSYGGGPGMVIEALPVVKAVEEAIGGKKKGAGSKDKGARKIIFFSPSGKQFTNKLADSWKNCSDIVMVCGRYEGIDARVKRIFPMIDISVGPYILTGGELPAMIVIDSITRRIPGVLGDGLSLEEERIASPLVYTRPEVITHKDRNYRVPKVLLTGHHKDIEVWKMNLKNKKI